LCDAFEAFIGAIFLDSGLAKVIEFMEPRLERAADLVLKDESLIDPRSELQIWAQAARGETPRYETKDTYGPDHERQFLIEVRVGDELKGQGVGRSKQEAAQKAAADALSRIGEN
jgi:ribonuclease-3